MLDRVAVRGANCVTKFRRLNDGTFQMTQPVEDDPAAARRMMRRLICPKCDARTMLFVRHGGLVGFRCMNCRAMIKTVTPHHPQSEPPAPLGSVPA